MFLERSYKIEEPIRKKVTSNLLQINYNRMVKK